MAAESRAALPLEGLRVLDLTNEWGLLSGSVLADLGADVIQVEPPGGSTARRFGPFKGDTMRPEDSLFWAAFARNKRGISIALGTSEGNELLSRLAASADILLESFMPGHLADLGIRYDELSAKNPRLIWTSVTPFGQGGPKAHWPASDLTVLASSTYLLWIGDKDRPPLGFPFPQSFHHASTEAATGVLVALRERRRSGLGQRIDVSAQEAMTTCTQSFILSSAWNDVALFRLPPGEMRSKTGLSGVYPAKDGYVAIGFFFGSGLGPIAVRFMHWIYEEGMCDERDRDKNWVNYMALLASGDETLDELDRIHGVLERFFQSKTKAELLEGALARGLLLFPANTAEDVLSSPQLEARNYWARSGDPADTYLYPGPFAQFSESPLQYRRRAPHIGEHNLEILGGELGLTPAEIAGYAARGIL
ncbi:hypothetical protein AYO38_09285 [bacterium SCGC AG-212-C10]|nr:hypothetical protein AYO38_09285 [bacterium SCGC AG-212-C10]